VPGGGTAGWVGALVVLIAVGLGAACGAAPAGTNSDAVTSEPAPSLAPGEIALVPYCNGQTMEITEPVERGRRLPAVIYFHGGSWIGGDHETGGFIVHQIGEALAARGFVVASANYRLGPHAPWPAQIVDAKCAVRYFRAHAKELRIDRNEIGVWGHSAGAHLASLVGTAGPDAGWDVGSYAGESSAVEAVADFAGPSNLTTLGEEGGPGLVQDNFESLLGHIPPEQIPVELEAASPVTHVSTGDPPVLVIHGDMDPIVPISQSEEFVHALQSAGVPVSFVVVHGGGHALDEPNADPNTEEIESLVVDFFVQHLHRTPFG
jgi:acetyl esterase/lipase